ncbi:uncharacterized protein BKA78DRAFT_80206 [Phyllosticta capitalensis]|uniref:uncharacterized protein n=1 Tax=Phyllosticta capitalensis TaxID=121624 RepID=UPI003131EEC1
MLPICVFFNMETFYCSTAASILLLSLGQAPTCATTFAMYQASVPMGQGGRPIPVSRTARRRRGPGQQASKRPSLASAPGKLSCLSHLARPPSAGSTSTPFVHHLQPVSSLGLLNSFNPPNPALRLPALRPHARSSLAVPSSGRPKIQLYDAD